MAFELRGRNAVAQQPAKKPPASTGVLPQHGWARDRTNDKTDDGYELTADDINEILKQLRNTLVVLGGDPAGTTGAELALALTGTLSSLKVADLVDDDDYVRMTTLERDKLAAVVLGYRGQYTSLATLQAAIPAGAVNEWAILTKGSAGTASMAAWDTDNVPPAWVDTGVAPPTVDWGNVLNKPARIDANPATTANLNTATGAGWYSANNSATNLPVAGVSSWAVLVLPGISASYLWQIAIGANAAVYMRTLFAGAWGAWTRLEWSPVFSTGISFGSRVGASADDLSQHVALFGSTVGFSITSARVNAVAPAGNTFWWRIGGSDVLSVSSSALTFLGNTVWHAGNKASVAEVRAGTATKAADVVTYAQADELVTLTDAATISVDMATFINATVTLAGNRTLASPTNEKIGQSGVIYFVQDATGNRTLAYGSEWKFPGGVVPTLSTAAGAVDVLKYRVRASGFIAAELVKDIK